MTTTELTDVRQRIAAFGECRNLGEEIVLQNIDHNLRVAVDYLNKRGKAGSTASWMAANDYMYSVYLAKAEAMLYSLEICRKYAEHEVV